MGVEEVPVGDAGDLSLEGADLFVRGPAFGDLLFEVDTTLGVDLANLADGHHWMAWLSWPLPRRNQRRAIRPVRGHLDSGWAVVGGELVRALEPSDVSGVTDEGIGEDRASPRPR